MGRDTLPMAERQGSISAEAVVLGGMKGGEEPSNSKGLETQKLGQARWGGVRERQRTKKTVAV